ncbi:MAG: hypothetical protein DRP59_12760 [Spirochaetes bacterium]|nr:MAG: hypothetical protein DRP59_12760 [Spirochaetota bacterium]
MTDEKIQQCKIGMQYGIEKEKTKSGFFNIRGRCLKLIDIDGFEQDDLEDADTGKKVRVTTIMFKGYTTQIPDPDNRIYNFLHHALEVRNIQALND